MKKLIITLGLIAAPTMVFAQVDIDQKMKLMKTNVEHADHNLEQNKNNMNISADNVNELTRVLGELTKLKSDGERDMKSATDNLAVLADTKKKYEEYIKEERDFIVSEEKNIQKIKALMDQVMANIEQRRKNIESYQKFVNSVDTKLADWENKRRTVASALEMVNQKSSVADNERKAWLEKTKLYKDEAGKWAKQKKVSEVNLDMFNKMRTKK